MQPQLWKNQCEKPQWLGKGKVKGIVNQTFQKTLRRPMTSKRSTSSVEFKEVCLLVGVLVGWWVWCVGWMVGWLVVLLFEGSPKPPSPGLPTPYLLSDILSIYRD